MKKLVWLSCAVLLLTLVSSSFALDPILVGNFEGGSTGSGTDIRWDNWMINLDSSAVTAPAVAATRDTHSLKWVDVDGGSWGNNTVKPYGEYGNSLETNIYYQVLMNPEAVIVVDVTAVPGQVTDYCSLALHWNAAGGWGVDSTAQNVIIDGLPHTYIFPISDALRTVITASFGGWGCNIGWMMSSGSGSTTIYLDNIWLYPVPPQSELLPHDGTIINEARIGTTLTENATLHWLAAADPNAATTGNKVLPDVVDQYVFWDDGAGGTLFYRGKTNADPGTTDPNSQFGPITWGCNKTYKWVVVDVLAGHTQALTIDSSTIANVDPNNLTSPTFNWKTISTLPAITTQPVNKRVALNATNATVFTVGVVDPSTTSFQWYSSADNVIDGEPTDVKINPASIPSAITNTLILPTAAAGYQRYYYCKVYNNYTTTGGGTSPDLYTNVVALVVERMVAQYTFENDLNDTNPTTADRHNGTGVNGPTFVTGGIEGTYALSLNGTNQYVTLGTAGYPKASLTGANGIGGGLDVGSILCWVKATQNGTILANADPNGATTLAMAADGTTVTVRGAATVGTAPNPYYLIVNDGNWHLVTATWDMSGVMRLRVDTELVQVTAAPTTFKPWMYSMLIGAGRPDANATIGNFFGGLIDNLRVYNYVITPEVIAQEYFDKTDTRTCIYPTFTGSTANLDNTGTSFCKVDLADFAQFALNWLNDGFYP